VLLINALHRRVMPSKNFEHYVNHTNTTYIVHSTRRLRGNHDKFIKPSATVNAYKFVTWSAKRRLIAFSIAHT